MNKFARPTKLPALAQCPECRRKARWHVGTYTAFWKIPHTKKCQFSLHNAQCIMQNLTQNPKHINAKMKAIP